MGKTRGGTRGQQNTSEKEGTSRDSGRREGGEKTRRRRWRRREAGRGRERKKSGGEGDNMWNCSPRPSDRDWFNGIRVPASSAIILHSENVHPPLVLWHIIHARVCARVPSLPPAPLPPRRSSSPPSPHTAPFGFTHLCQRYEFRSVSYSRRICTVQIRVNVVVVAFCPNGQPWPQHNNCFLGIFFIPFFFGISLRFEDLSILNSLYLR